MLRIGAFTLVLLAARAVAAQPGATPAPAPAPAPAGVLDERFRALSDPDPAARARALDAIALDSSSYAEAWLVGLLASDPSEEVRVAAARAILRRGDPNLASTLATAASRDPSPAVRQAAGDAHDHLWPLGKRPRLAAGYSLLCPGCGHFYLRRPGQAIAYLGTTAALVGGGIALVYDNESADSVLDPEDPDHDAEDALVVPLLAGAQNLWFYSIFDAYRDARQMRGDRGAKRPITDESLGHLASAPFRPRVLASPWVWGVVPVAFGLGIGLSYLLEPEALGEGEPSIFEVDRLRFLGGDFSSGVGFAFGEVYWASVFTSVAVGEEALFRGFIQTELTEAYGPWTGWAVGSVIFGAAHIFNFTQPGTDAVDAFVAVPFITLVGSTLGLAYMKTDYRLETSVAMHFWYDFLLATASFVVDPEHQPFAARLRGTF